MYYIIYENGASQYCEAPNIKGVVSMISAGACRMLIDGEKNRALIMNKDKDGKKNIGWATMTEFGGFSDEEIELLE